MHIRFASPVSRPAAIGGLTRADSFVRHVSLDWRRLSDPASARGVPTLVACSGGADSTALLLALALASRDVAAAFIIHDLRTRELELADARFVEDLCEHLRIPFILGEVTSEGGNAEGRSRDRRYALLATLARARGIGVVATAHHADDQLETLIMALVRGSGLAGLRGIAPRRAIGSDVALVRPMLRCSRAEAQGACTRAGVVWREDHTNDDTRRLRAALRAGPLAELVRLRPSAPARAAAAAELLRDAHALVEERITSLARTDQSWTRAELRAQPAIVVGGLLRRIVIRKNEGKRADDLSNRIVAATVDAIRDQDTSPRTFTWPGGAVIRITAQTVEVRP